MPYSLVSAATLGFDLVRLPGGRAVAEVLLTGLLADAADLARVADAHPARGMQAEQRGVLAVRSRRARELTAGVPSVRTASAGAERAAVLVAQLEQGTIGDAPTLERLVREDVLGPDHPDVAVLPTRGAEEAADVLADAAVGYWAAGVLPPLVRRELTAAFDRVADGGAVTDRAADLGPATADVEALLGALARLDSRGRAAWRDAVDEGRAEHRPWATAMHEASWAAHVSGRTRALATAQLLAVQAFLDGGFSVSDGASGCWNAVAGCVQGTVMADLLDEGSLGVLLAPARRVAGTA